MGADPGWWTRASRHCRLPVWRVKKWRATNGWAVVPASDFAGQSEVALAALARRRFLLSGGGCEVHIRQLIPRLRAWICRRTSQFGELPPSTPWWPSDWGSACCPELALTGRAERAAGAVAAAAAGTPDRPAHTGRRPPEPCSGSLARAYAIPISRGNRANCASSLLQEPGMVLF